MLLSYDNSGTGTVTYGTDAAENADNQTIVAWHERSIPTAEIVQLAAPWPPVWTDVRLP
jgi:hypothetical protein